MKRDCSHISHPAGAKHRRAVTLIEVMVTVVVLGVIGTATLPVIMGVSEAYSNSTSARAALERSAFAADRISRWLREIPGGTDYGTVSIQKASTDALQLSDGRAIELIDGQIVLRDAAGNAQVLVENVTDLEFKCYAADGVSSVELTPEQTQRIAFRLTADGASLAGVAFIRSRSTEP